MNLQEIKKGILDLNQEELKELNHYIVDRSRYLGRQAKFNFHEGQRIKCDGDYFTITKMNRSKAKCLKEGTNQTWNIPFSMMSAA